MNGNPQYHAIAPASATLLLLPLPPAVLAGRTPAWVRARVAEPRWYALAMTAVWLPAPFNALPRMAGAGTGVVMTCTVVSVACAATAVALFARAARRAGAAARP
ncbi:hypothetical protein ACWDYJ_20970 [Streptomyces sp. NPDC003042]